MPKVMKHLLIEALTEALETAAFMMPLPPEEDLPSPSQGVLVCIDFTGSANGKIELWASNEFAQMMAANIMGIEPEDEEAKSKSIDALKQLAHITAGVLLKELTDSSADIFNLTVPKAQEQSDSGLWEEYVSQDDVFVLDVDGFPLAARLLMEN